MGDEVMKRSFAVLLAILMLLMAMPIGSYADASVPPERLKISFDYEGIPIPGATFSAYLIAPGTLTNSGVTFQTKSEYTSMIPAVLDGLSESKFEEYSELLEAYIYSKLIAADYYVKTDANGVGVMNLPYGVYLLRQTAAEGVAAQFTMAPTCIAIVPAFDPKTGEMIEAVVEPKPVASPTPSPSPTPTATPTPTPEITPTPTPGGTPNPYNPPTNTPTPTNTPKVTPSPTPVITNTPEPEEERIDLEIRKDWADFSNADGVRPESIRLYLYRKPSTAATFPEEAYMNVDVTGVGDQWHFVFKGLVSLDVNGIRYDYLIREGEVTGYSPIYEDNNGVITNVHPTYTPAPGTTPTPVPTITVPPTLPPGVPVGVIEIDGQWYYIDEYGVPLGLVPQTGDEAQLILYAGCALVFVAAAVYLFMMLYRRRKEA